MTQRPCLSPEALADFILGSGTEDDKRHMAKCEACKRRMSFLRRIVSAGVDPIVGSTAEVDELITALLAARPHTWWKIVLEPEYRHLDIARRLLSLAIDARLRDRQLSVDLTKAVTTIVDRLMGGGQAEADLRFEAWKFASVVLRETGRYSEAESAFVCAEEAAKASSDPELAQAAVLLSRALFCAEPDVWKPEEAAELLDRAEQVLLARNDTARMQAAMTARAFLLFRSGDTRSACEKFTALLEATPKSDRENYLNALSNALWVRVELREADVDVEKALAFLIEENDELGRSIQVARARWMMGRVLVVRREYDGAIDLLRASMIGIADTDSSIRIGLDAIEALLLDNRYQKAFALAREIASLAVALDQREPSRRHGLTAQVFTYLREAAQRQALTADLAADVGRYVDRITRQRPVDFIPPMPLADM